jgi:hypothetical protein
MPEGYYAAVISGKDRDIITRALRHHQRAARQRLTRRTQPTPRGSPSSSRTRPRRRCVSERRDHADTGHVPGGPQPPTFVLDYDERL